MKFARHHFSPVRRLAAIVLAVAPLFGPATDRLGAQPAPQQPVPETLDLATAVRFALTNNFAIRQARERIKQQEGVVIEVSARSIPNATIGSAYSRIDQGLTQSFSPSVPINTQSWQIGLTVSQHLFAGGGVRAAMKSSQLAREAALLDLQAVINNALLAVRTAFFDVLLAREKIKVQESNLELLQQQLKTAIDRYEAGTVSRFEQLRAEVAVANARVPLITARNDYRLAIESLRQGLGFATATPPSVGKVPDFLGTLDYTPQNFDLQAAFDAALAHRPDLQRLAKIVAAREQDVRTQRAAYYPTVGVIAGYQFKNAPYAVANGSLGVGSNRFNEALGGWTLGLQSQWAIFDGRATAGRVAQTKSALEQTRLSLTEAQLAVEVEVRRAFSQWQQAVELADASQKVVEQATEAVRLANARYTAGTSTQLDVLQAQVDLTTARTNQIQAYYGFNVAVAALRKAMGQADEFVTK